MLLCNLYSSETTFWLLLLRIVDRTVNLGVYLVTDDNLLPLSVLPLLHTFGYRHSFEKVNWRGMLVRMLSLKRKKNYFHLLEELCYNCSPSHIHMALSSGCHLQGVYLTTNHGNVTKVTVTILWLIATASLVSIYGSGPSFNVSLLDYFISFIICQAKIVRLIIWNSYMPFKT